MTLVKVIKKKLLLGLSANSGEFQRNGNSLLSDNYLRNDNDLCNGKQGFMVIKALISALAHASASLKATRPKQRTLSTKPTASLLPATVLGVILPLLTVFVATHATAQTVLRAAVASNFTASAQQLAKPFEQTHKVKIHWISGASGGLYQQIRHGAPFDVFFSADKERPARLVNEGFVDAATLAPYAIGQLAIYSANNASLTANDLATSDVLSKPFAAKRIALANPDTAPYGKAAKSWLEKQGLWQHYRTKVIVGSNVSQTFQQTHSGAVDFGFVAVSQLIAHNITASKITLDDQYMLSQYAGVVTRSKQQALAKQLIAYFRAPAQQSKLEALGYLPVTLTAKTLPAQTLPAQQNKASTWNSTKELP
ncbi:molybdate ABC transporter substrate-binding protein [Thalassotalea euphylliae]|uniref:Molybdate ABC transporter substrate-binding protein n=1 Tax=Thalassotalea euphylliae TaxID=1655234 RepID=A0A3E0TMS7_9GAMM|nr:molybdate ABC transporter substrate-binding protein [Thalassotalea euphylliae]REL25798.1 molybdate ABC transporter substrate-binding protein [Thalassotalea euphylliae]